MNLNKLQRGTPLISVDELADALKTTVRDAEFLDTLIPSDDQNIVNLNGGTLTLPADAPVGYSAALVSGFSGQTHLAVGSGASLLNLDGDAALKGSGATATVLVNSQNALKTAASYILAGTGTAPYNDTTPWTPRTAATADNWNDVTYSASLDRLVAVGFTAGVAAAIMTSDDRGVTWTAQTAPATTGPLGKVVWAEALGKYFAASYNSVSIPLPRVIESVDGVTWSTSLTSDATVSSVIYIPGRNRLLACGFDATRTLVFTSDDGGATWATHDISSVLPWATSSLENFGYSPELNLVVGIGNAGMGTDLMWSEDYGSTWTAVPSTVGDTYGTVVWSAELRMFVAAATGTGTPNIWSTTGKSWSKGAAAIGDGIAITWAPEYGLFVGTGIIGPLFNNIISADGKTFSVVDSADAGAGAIWTGLAVMPGQVLTVAYATGAHAVQTSNPL